MLSLLVASVWNRRLAPRWDGVSSKHYRCLCVLCVGRTTIEMQTGALDFLSPGRILNHISNHLNHLFFFLQHSPSWKCRLNLCFCFWSDHKDGRATRCKSEDIREVRPSHDLNDKLKWSWNIRRLKLWRKAKSRETPALVLLPPLATTSFWNIHKHICCLVPPLKYFLQLDFNKLSNSRCCRFLCVIIWFREI